MFYNTHITNCEKQKSKQFIPKTAIIYQYNQVPTIVEGISQTWKTTTTITRQQKQWWNKTHTALIWFKALEKKNGIKQKQTQTKVKQ